MENWELGAAELGAVVAVVLSVVSIVFSYKISTKIQSKEHEFQWRMFALARVHEAHGRSLDAFVRFEGNYLYVNNFPKDAKNTARKEAMTAIYREVINLLRSSKHLLVDSDYKQLEIEIQNISKAQVNPNKIQVLPQMKDFVRNVRIAHEKALVELAPRRSLIDC